MIVQSLWHDHDLACATPDLDRAERLWEGARPASPCSPTTAARPCATAGPLAYPLAALPFYALFGPRGIALFNMALFLAMAGAALWHFPRRRRPSPSSSPASSSPRRRSPTSSGWSPRSSPWPASSSRCSSGASCGTRAGKRPPRAPRRRRRPARRGPDVEPLVALLGPARSWSTSRARRRWRGPRAPWSLPALLAASAFLALLQRAGTGEWTRLRRRPAPDLRGRVPARKPARPLAGRHPSDAARRLGLATGLRLLPRNLRYLLAGRFTGTAAVLPLRPLRPRPLSRGAEGPLAASPPGRPAGVYAGLVLIGHPHDFAGTPGFLGSRYLALVYPAFLFLPGRLRARRSLAIPYAAAGLWTAAAVAHALRSWP